ncbi:MAG: UvrD-helicase domain-containing protein [Gammaproteobacteria bacterium AqS3]|nr:UvrD-helicase domain-containing protein [Gammaproteobacteria bacterium AqS3]
MSVQMNDAQVRAQAVDPSGSYIVRAPAGSGKTSLLVHRYLNLLSGVNRPEEVLCVTFTVKATAEMRERIVGVLRRAADSDEAGLEGQKLEEYRAARRVLERDAQRGWGLLRSADQLNISTLDGLCANIVRALPVGRASAASGRELIVPGYGIEQNPRSIFEHCTRRLLLDEDLPEAVAEARSHLLSLYRTDMQKLSGLIIEMLSQRADWVQTVVAVEGAEELAENYGTFVQFWIDQVRGWALGRLEQEGGSGEQRRFVEALKTQADWGMFYQAAYTKSGTVRSRQSTPLSHELLEGMLGAGLGLLSQLPQDDFAWYPHLRTFMLHLLADVAVEMMQRGVADFTGVALAADAALGNEDEVTDLARALDYRLQHILVDEFQDTSELQLKLLRQLVVQWQPDEGRTLLLVGDTAQSCYGFRGARPGLFNLVEQVGIGELRLTPLKLSSNFRSHPAVVNEINALFGRAFPDENDINTGAAPYVGMQPQQEAGEIDGGVSFDLVEIDSEAYFGQIRGAPPEVKRQHERYRTACRRQIIERGVEFVRRALADLPDTAAEARGQVAILVRKRGDLPDVVNALERAGVAYSADSTLNYKNSPAVRACIALARVLRNGTDRVALTALLRSPLCGLSLAELHAIAGAAPKRRSLWEALRDGRWRERLPGERAAAVDRVLTVFARMRTGSRSGDFVERVQRAWSMLGGPSVLGDSARIDELLAALGDWGENWAEREDYFLNSTFIPGSSGEERVRLMTIHNAKGLEFGAVWIPSITGEGRNTLTPLLHTDAWSESLTTPQLPLAGLGRDHAHFKYIDAERNRQEVLRLLYIAATRAIYRLHISTAIVLPRGDYNILTMYSVVRHLDTWSDRVMEAPEPEQIPADVSSPAAGAHPPDETRPHYWHPQTPPPLPAAASERDSESFAPAVASPDARALGSLVHLLLEGWAKNGEAFLGHCRSGRFAGYCRSRLRVLGVAPQALDGLIANALDCLESAASDLENAWLFAQGEYAEAVLLHRREQGELRELRVDRLVRRDDGTRWIIDYKTGARGRGESLASYSARQLRQADEQLHRYFQAISAAFPGEPCRCGLYFPHERHLAEWSPRQGSD